MLDLLLLRFFIAIYEEKNIMAAVEPCHVSQPSISAGLCQFEEAFDDSLFIRGKKGVGARDPAHYIYPHEVKPALGGGIAATGTGRVARTGSHSFRLQRQPTVGMLEALRREAGRRRTFWRYGKRITCSACRSIIPWPAARKLSWLICDRLTLNLVAKAESKGLVMALVLAGVGISFLPDGLVEDAPGLCILPVSGPRMFRRIGGCYPAHQTLNLALRELIPELAGHGAS